MVSARKRENARLKSAGTSAGPASRRSSDGLTSPPRSAQSRSRMIPPSADPVQSDLDVAIAAVCAAVAAAERARTAPLRTRTKGAAFDVVTEADRAAEQAAADVLRRHRPRDGILGEEGTDTPGARRWVVDGV